MNREDESAARDYFLNLIPPHEAMEVKQLWPLINRAPETAKIYLERKCRDFRELEEFFKDNDDLFYLENMRVGLADGSFSENCKVAELFFEERLKLNGEPIDYNILNLRLEHAPPNIRSFLTKFYPGKELKKFFKQRQNIFVLHKNHTVYLVEVDSVDFYRKRLRRGQKEHFMRFRGHIGQAPPYIQSFINRNYNDDDFQDFLIRNNNVFHLDDDGLVSLVPPK